MKAMLEGNAYKYWINGGVNVRLHLCDGDINLPNAVTVTPNHIAEDVTYANQALKILWCCGDGSVELHHHIEDEIDLQIFHGLAKQAGCAALHDDERHMMTLIPPARIGEETFNFVLFQLYDIEAFEMWDGDTNTGEIDLF